MATALASFDVNALAECLASLPPVELKGVALLKGRHPDGSPYPGTDKEKDRRAVIEARTELLGYAEACRSVATKLGTIEPIIAPASIPEFGL